MRMQNLLSKAAKRFDDGGSPFEHDWLVENNVTLDECYDLSENVASAIRVYQVILRWVAKGNGPERQMAAMILAESLKDEINATV